MATQREVAVHLDLSQAAVSNLAAAGVIAAGEGRVGYDVDASRTAYIRHLREQAAGRAGSNPQGLNLADERARLAAAQAEAQERKNALDRGELVSLSNVSNAVHGVIERVKARLATIGAAVAKGDVQLRRRIDTAVEDVLTELAGTPVLELPEPGDDDEGED